VIVPGIAFDTSGARIGYGKGHYDRILKGFNRPIVAFAYELQITDEAIPTEAHDVRVTTIVTEKRIIEI
jgi:5-formyltetrahydrofolate cyclo-ligase